MKLKRIMAAGLAATMVMSSGSVVGAENSSTITGGGDGTLEGVVDTDVFNVVLPTVTTDTFNYIADPQGLIAKTDEANYSGKTFSEGTLFFANTATDKKYDYSNQSDKLNAINKSSKKIKLSVAAKATVGASGESNAALAANADSLSADSPEVYLAITDGTTSKTLKADDEKLEQVLGGAPEAAYEYKYDADTQKYNYGLKSDVSTCKFAEYSVYVEGKASENGWKEGTTLPSINVVWSAEFAGEGDAVTIETPAQTLAHSTVADVTLPGSGIITVPVTLGADGAVPTKLVTKMYGSEMDLFATEGTWGVKYESGNIKFGTELSAWMIENSTTVKADTFKVTFDKGDAVSFKFK